MELGSVDGESGMREVILWNRWGEGSYLKMGRGISDR